MTTKEINGKLCTELQAIKTKEGYVFVNDDEIKKNDWFLLNNNSFPAQYNSSFGLNKKETLKIHASTYPLGNITVIDIPEKDDELTISELAEKYSPITYNQLGYPEKRDYEKALQLAFINGYKANPCQYTVEHLKLFQKFMSDYYTSQEAVDNLGKKTNEEVQKMLLKRFLQSFTPSIKSIWVEVVETTEVSNLSNDMGTFESKIHKIKPSATGQPNVVKIKY